MGAGRRSSYNPRTGKWTRPKAWYDKGRKSTSKTRSTRSRKKSSNNGCYVATAIYGSYDCPEVWTLRRYRDNYLMKSFIGRLFVRVYYTISPTMVKYFGRSKWFHRLFRCKLDSMVMKLNAKGYSSDKYEDPRY